MTKKQDISIFIHWIGSGKSLRHSIAPLLISSGCLPIRFYFSILNQMWFLVLVFAVSLSVAQGNPANVVAGSSASASAKDAADTSSANLATFADINIFSQLPLGSVFILWSNFRFGNGYKKANHKPQFCFGALFYAKHRP